jgi:hypothetical protein
MLSSHSSDPGVVTIHVSDDNHEKIFKLYKAAICQLPFFRAALHGVIQEGAGRVQRIDIRDTSPKIFEMFVEWSRSTRKSAGRDKAYSVEDLVDLWSLAETITIPRLQDQVMQKTTRRLVPNQNLPTSLCKHIQRKSLKAILR